MELQVPSLVGTVYGQSWPAPTSTNRPQNTGGRRGFQGFKKIVQRPANASGDRFRRRPPPVSPSPSYDDPPLTANNSPRTATGTHTLLDRETEFWKNWTKRSPRSNPRDSDSEEARDDDYDLSLYKITQDTFRKLTNQVKEVNDYVMNKAQPSSFKRYYTNGHQAAPAIRHSQLAAAVAASRRQRQLELEADPYYESASGSEAGKIFPPSIDRSSRHLRGFRPKSQTSRPASKMSQYGPPGSASSHRFDHLSPEIAVRLGDTLRTTPFYVVSPGPFKTTIPDPLVTSDSEEKTTETDDGGTPKTTEEEEEESGNEEALIRVSDCNQQSEARGATGPPEFTPEDFESLEEGPNLGYKHKLVAQPRFDYLEPLEEPFDKLDLAKMSRVEGDWKVLLERTPTAEEEQMLERLVEMTRFTSKTVEWEQEKLKSSRRTSQKSKVPAAKTRSKNCLESCLQPGCLGECRNKQQVVNGAGCPHCRQLYCTGTCTEYGYHYHVRSTERLPLEDQVKGQRPKSSCRSCGSRGSLRSHRINVNNRTLGRPRSANATFSTANLYTIKPKLITPVLDDSGDGGEATPPLGGRSRPSTGRSRGGAAGRDAILLHKSWESQRKNSLTEPIRIDFVKSNAVRVKSAKKKSKSRKKK